MMVCPVCEHPQPAGRTCEVCGKELSPAASVVVADVPLEGLEGTRLATTPGNVPAVPIPELEATRISPGRDIPPEPVPGLDVFLPAAAGAVPAEAVPDLDSGRYLDGDPRVVLPAEGAVTCRYCKNVQATGRVCEKCGMRLPRAAPASGATGAGAVQGEEARCQACGAKGRAAERCSDCGLVVRGG